MIFTVGFLYRKAQSDWVNSCLLQLKESQAFYIELVFLRVSRLDENIVHPYAEWNYRIKILGNDPWVGKE